MNPDIIQIFNVRRRPISLLAEEAFGANCRAFRHRFKVAHFLKTVKKKVVGQPCSVIDRL